MSLVMGKRPDLLTAYLHSSSKWNGDLEILVKSQTPVYIVVGEDDEYYGSKSSKDTYEEIYRLYHEQGLSKEDIDDLLILDIKEAQYFEHQGITNQHGYGGHLFANDQQTMGWLFSKKRSKRK